MYQRQGKAAYKADLQNTWDLAELINNPQNSFRSVHIAGTNGKGSTAHMLCSILMEAGYKTGLYTSPHLIDFRERIRINGQMIPEDSVVEFYEKYHSKWQVIQPSFFEMTVLMAFDYFREREVDIAVIETGLGGRLDSTNIVIPDLSIITNIGLDHTQFLGTTIEEIALEKAGIIKENTPVVIGNMLPEAERTIRSRAEEVNAPFHHAASSKTSYKSDLNGDFQKDNISTVVKAVSILNTQQGYFVQDVHIKAGLANVKPNTQLKGRYDIVSHAPKVILDGAHNREGIQTLLKELENENFDTLRIVWSMVSDKDANNVFKQLPKKAQYYLCKSSIPRAMKIEDLSSFAAAHNLLYEDFSTVKEAYSHALKDSQPNDLILVTGSFFTVADYLSI